MSLNRFWEKRAKERGAPFCIRNVELHINIVPDPMMAPDAIKLIQLVPLPPLPSKKKIVFININDVKVV